MATLTPTATTGTAGPPPRGRLGRWVLPDVGAGRIAWLRLVVYLAVALNVAVVNGDVDHGSAAQLWQPVTVLRLLHAPPPDVPVLRTVQVVLIAAALLAATGRAPRALGWPVALLYLAWQLVDNSYGKRDHDEFPMLVGLFALASVRRVRFGDTGRDEAASFAVRCIQVAVVCVYFFSAVTKIRNVGWRWTSSSIFAWSLLRRGHPWSRPLLQVPGLLVFSQYALISLEFLSPVMLFLRRRWAALAAAGWVLFHLGTWAAIGIHFLPTAVCLAAFLPLETLPGWWQRRRRARTSPPAAT